MSMMTTTRTNKKTKTVRARRAKMRLKLVLKMMMIWMSEMIPPMKTMIRQKIPRPLMNNLRSLTKQRLNQSKKSQMQKNLITCKTL